MKKPPHARRDLQDHEVKEEIKAISEESQRPPLPESEWNFFPKGTQPPPEWQLNHWLNYEYARSCEDIKNAVRELRERTVERRDVGTYPKEFKGPRFSVYLNKYYPEFPCTPWRELPSAKRSRRTLERVGNDLSNPFDQDIMKSYDPFIFNDLIQTGEMSLRPGILPDPGNLVMLDGKPSPHPGELNDETFAIFEIDFTNTNKRIVQKFREWLTSRRKTIMAQFTESRINRLVTPSAKTSRRGQRANRRTYEAFLNQLAAMRLMEHCNQDYLRCAEITKKINGRFLYTEEQTSWSRAQDRAKNLMGRFKFAWRHSFLPSFILNPDDYRETLSHNLAAPFPK
jgi:hypothetical protein